MTDASPRCDLDLDLNYSNWKEFKIGDLFEIVNSFPYHTKDIIEDTGGIPYIVRSKFNNGLKYRVRRPENTNPAGVISFGAENATFFYQSEEWCSGNKMYYIDTSAITEQACQFVIVCLMTLTQKYSYDNGMIPELLRQEIIKLPATPDGKPDFKFMELYMLNIFSKSKAGLESLQLADTAKIPVDIRSWKEFKIGELFNVVKGTRLTKADQKSGDINFVSASAFNNGITATISNDSHIHPGNNLTVNYDGSIGYTFYQEQPFWALDDVNVLYPKFEMTKNIALFIAPIIKSVGSKHAYENKWTLEVMKADKISLPVTADGKPDFKFMERYMQEILDDAEAKINALLDY